MNVAVVSAAPGQTIADKAGWVADGFRAAGHDVRRCHSLAQIAAADAECDMLLFDQYNAGVCRNSLAEFAPRRRAKWVQWWRDLVAFEPKETLAQQPAMQSYRRLMGCMDLCLVKERSLLPGYRELGVKARWFDQACPANMPACEHHERPEWDVLVLGSSTSYKQRLADATALADAGLKVLWAGLGGFTPENIEGHPWVHPLELPALASRCGVVLGVDWRSDIPGYTSDRTYLVAGMGACYVHRSHSLMPGAVPAFLYGDQRQLLDTVKRLTGNVSLRRQIGEAARREVMAHHTYRHRADELTALLERSSCDVLQPC